MKRNSKRTKKIRNLILVCVMSALLLTVSTYAWFIGMQTVKVNSFEVKIASVDSLMLSMDGESWATSIDVSKATQYTGNANEFLTGTEADGITAKGLKPISTIGEFDSTASRLKLYEKGSLTATKGGYRLMASRVENNKTKKTDSDEYLEGDGYVAFDLFFLNLTGDQYYPTNEVANEEAIYLTYDSKVTAGTTGNTVSGIENSVRVGFAQIARVSASTYGNLPKGDDKVKTITGMNCDSKVESVTSICRTAQIWEPNEKTHVTAAKTWYDKTCLTRKGDTDTDSDGNINKTFTYDTTKCASLDTFQPTYAVASEITHENYVDVYDGLNSYNTETTLLNPVDTFTDTEKMESGNKRLPFMTLAPNSITKVRVYIWIEGQDVDSYDFASLGHSILVNFGFTKERFTAGEIGSDIKPGDELNAETLPTTAEEPSSGE